MALEVGLVYSDSSKCPISNMRAGEVEDLNVRNIPLNGSGLSSHDISSYDVLVFFVDLDVLHGTDWIRSIRETPEAPGLLIMLPFEDVGRMKELIHQGVRGFLSPNCKLEEVLRSIRNVARGKRYIDPAFSDPIVENFLSSS